MRHLIIFPVLALGLASCGGAPPPRQSTVVVAPGQTATLQPGQTGHVHLTLDQRAFSYWDVNSHSWLPAPGPYQIMVGSSSRDIRLQSH